RTRAPNGADSHKALPDGNPTVSAECSIRHDRTAGHRFPGPRSSYRTDTTSSASPGSGYSDAEPVIVNSWSPCAHKVGHRPVIVSFTFRRIRSRGIGGEHVTRDPAG